VESVVSVTPVANARRKKKMTETLKKATRVYIVNGRPAHTHTCSESHTWDCDSPYCEQIKADCPEHGGLEPIVVGREPWRGR
jgi:hypothetical protein